MTEAEGPVRLCEQPEAFLGTAGALCIFTNYTYHAASPYTKLEGQRYVWKHAWGRADFPHEGTAHYTMFGSDPSFRQFIPQISPRQTLLLSIPSARRFMLHGGDAPSSREAVPGVRQRRVLPARGSS